MKLGLVVVNWLGFPEKRFPFDWSIGCLCLVTVEKYCSQHIALWKGHEMLKFAVMKNRCRNLKQEHHPTPVHFIITHDRVNGHTGAKPEECVNELPLKPVCDHRKLSDNISTALASRNQQILLIYTMLSRSLTPRQILRWLSKPAAKTRGRYDKVLLANIRQANLEIVLSRWGCWWPSE